MMSPQEHLEESINYALKTIELGKNKTIEPPIKEKKYIIRYGHTKFYIGEEREIMMLGANEYVSARDFIIVDNLKKATPLTEKQVKEIMLSSLNDENHKKNIGFMNVMEYCNLD